MTVSYDQLTGTFLTKITEYNFLKLREPYRQDLMIEYIRSAATQFSITCRVGITKMDDDEGVIEFNGVQDDQLYEVLDILTDGMVTVWMSQYMYKQENMENMLNTADFSAYSPAELLGKVTAAYTMCKRNFKNRLKAYSYDHGDLTQLHL